MKKVRNLKSKELKNLAIKKVNNLQKTCGFDGEDASMIAVIYYLKVFLVCDKVRTNNMEEIFF